MSRPDRRFALMRGTEPWYAVMIEDRDTQKIAFRVSGKGKRDAHKQAQQLTDLREVARFVIRDGMKVRCPGFWTPGSPVFPSAVAASALDQSGGPLAKTDLAALLET